MTKFIFLLFTVFLIHASVAQTKYKTWHPAEEEFSVLEGRVSTDSGGFYHRLPAGARKHVPERVWTLSQNAAGLQIRFQTNADEIIIKYIVTENFQRPHMPVTGVSGVDLYVKTIDGEWLWCAGKFAFRDTVTFRFSNLVTNDQHVNNREYTLYLPLYNSVGWMEIAVPEECHFNPLTVRNDKPLIVYGTSIAQGACSPRPGLAWTAILGRRLDRPVVNLGFSGSGELDKGLLDLMAKADAYLYILDCLPNMPPHKYTEKALKQRIVDAVQLLQSRQPDIPILLADHGGFTNEGTNDVIKNEIGGMNRAFREVFDSLRLAGVKNIYRLTKEQIGQGIETTVDGIHPNALGMMRYAMAYEDKIREIFGTPVGNISTTQPVAQRRHPACDFERRHSKIIEHNKARSPKAIFMGNSFTFPGDKGIAKATYWMLPDGARTEGIRVADMSFVGDRIENVLWRVHHGELDDISPEEIILMAGTHNLEHNTDKEIVHGLEFLIDAIQKKQPKARVLLLGILPRIGMEERIRQLNRNIATIPRAGKIQFFDPGRMFTKRNGGIDESLYADRIHLNEKGVEVFSEFLERRLR